MKTKYITIDEVFETENKAVENVLNNQVAKQSPKNGVIPVCVKHQISKTKVKYGMQFWTISEIAIGYIILENTVFTLC